MNFGYIFECVCIIFIKDVISTPLKIRDTPDPELLDSELFVSGPRVDTKKIVLNRAVLDFPVLDRGCPENNVCKTVSILILP